MMDQKFSFYFLIFTSRGVKLLMADHPIFRWAWASIRIDKPLHSSQLLSSVSSSEAEMMSLKPSTVSSRWSLLLCCSQLGRMHFSVSWQRECFCRLLTCTEYKHKIFHVLSVQVYFICKHTSIYCPNLFWNMLEKFKLKRVYLKTQDSWGKASNNVLLYCFWCNTD